MFITVKVSMVCTHQKPIQSLSIISIICLVDLNPINYLLWHLLKIKIQPQKVVIQLIKVKELVEFLNLFLVGFKIESIQKILDLNQVVFQHWLNKMKTSWIKRICLVLLNPECKWFKRTEMVTLPWVSLIYRTISHFLLLMDKEREQIVMVRVAKFSHKAFTGMIKDMEQFQNNQLNSLAELLN